MGGLLTDEGDGGAGDDGREDLLEVARLREAHEDLKQGGNAGGAEQGAVAVRAGQGVAGRVRGAEAGGVHLLEGARGHGNGGKGGADDGDEAGANVVGRLVDVEAGDLDG